MSIIKQNPFRILGLPGNATERELQKQLGKIKAFARIGKEITFDYDFEFIGDFTRTTDDIQQASNRIEQAHNKLIYSLFWFVNNTKFDEIAFDHLKEKEIEKAIDIWNKTLREEITVKNYSSYLNLSSLYLALSIISNPIDLQKLENGISIKGALIHSESLKDLSKLVTGNGISNDPIAISKKFVDEMIELLKPYLNKKNEISRNDLISFFNTFPASIQKYVLSKFTEAPISNIEHKIEKTIINRKNNPSNADEYGEHLYTSTKSDITLLKKLMSSSNLQFQMLSDKLANEILQCSIDFFNEREKNDNQNNFETYLNKTIKLVKLADSVPVSSQVKQRVKENIEILNDMKDREINQAIELLEAIKEAYVKACSEIDKQVEELQYETILDFDSGENIRIPKSGVSIDWGKVKEMKRQALDWNKIVELILEEIPKSKIEKIRNTKNSSKLKQFHELVDFLFDKLSYSNQKRIRYLKFWKTEKFVSIDKSMLITPIDIDPVPDINKILSTYTENENKKLHQDSKKIYYFFIWTFGLIAGIIGGVIGDFVGFFLGLLIVVFFGKIIYKVTEM